MRTAFSRTVDEVARSHGYMSRVKWSPLPSTALVNRHVAMVGRTAVTGVDGRVGGRGAVEESMLRRVQHWGLFWNDRSFFGATVA